MSNLIQIEMTLDEARETDRLIKRHINTTRYLLLDIRDRNGWKALGYESFGQLRPLAQVPESERKAIWDEATRKAEEEQAKLTARLVEEAVAEWKRRAHEFGDEANERRKKIRELETQVDLLKAAEPKLTQARKLAKSNESKPVSTSLPNPENNSMHKLPLPSNNPSSSRDEEQMDYTRQYAHAFRDHGQFLILLMMILVMNLYLEILSILN